MEHLSLEIFDLEGTGSKYAVLPDDTSITMTVTSELFASGDAWSHSFTLNIPANAHIFGTAGDIHGARLHELLDKRRARLWVEQLPLLLGYLKLDDEADVDEDGNVDVSFQSGNKTFEELIEGAKANQVPMIGDVRIGVAQSRKRWTRRSVRMVMTAVIRSLGTWSYWGYLEENGSKDITFEADGVDNPTQEFPRMVFPKGRFYSYDEGKDVDIDCLNTDEPYSEGENGMPIHPYCNIALCYQRYGYKKKNEWGEEYEDFSTEPEAERGYEEMPANRVNSAPNFYVIYWIRALMNHLGIYIEENQMMDVEDLRRLFFVNTSCAYRDPRRKDYDPTVDYGTIRWYSKEYWHEHGSEMTLVPEKWDPRKTIDISDCKFEITNYTPDIESPVEPVVERVAVHVEDASEEQVQDNLYWSHNDHLHDAYATPDCFPDVDISEVIKAIEDGFGVRFLFSNDYKRVRIVLLRNVFRDMDVQDIACDIHHESKTENCIKGFRLTYGNSEDTHFYYKGFADKLPHKKVLWPDDSDKHDYSHWKLDAEYGDIINKVSAFDKTCYVTPDTGNAFGIKIDKDAKRYQDLHPSLFEFAGFMDAEDGDCTGDENTIHEIQMGFTPAIMNDMNMESERQASSDEEKVQRFALFVDEKMRPRRLDLNDGKDYNASGTYYDTAEMYRKYGPDGSDGSKTHDDGIVAPGEFAIRSDMYCEKKNLFASLTRKSRESEEGVHFTLDIKGSISEGYRLYLQDNYEPNDDGISPIESHKWGLTLGIMRGSGSDGGVVYEADPQDEEGNDTWERVAGSNVTAHPDTCDCYGRMWDYNGSGEGVGNKEGRLSLKLRAEKPNPDFDPSKPEGPDNQRYLAIDNEDLRERGIADQLYKEFSKFIRESRVDNFNVSMEIAQLMNINLAKKARIGDVMGFIRKMKYTVSKKTGLGTVDVELLYI